MKRLKQEITINGKVLPFFTDCVVVTSRNNFTDTATLTIPNRISKRNNRISDIIEKGSPVIIKFGYFPNMYTEFEGYVSEVIPDKTAIVKCENEAYNLKRQSIGTDIIQKSTSLVELMLEVLNANFKTTSISFKTLSDGSYKSINSQIETYVFQSNIGDFSATKTSTVIDVLAELQSKYKIYSYFRGSTLIVGAQADPREKETIQARFQRNVPMGESSFNFKESSADRIVVKATNIERDGTINEVFAYYDGTPAEVVYSSVQPTSGVVNEFNIGGQSNFSEDDLKRLARIRLEALSFTGVDGSVTIYGNSEKACATHGDLCQVTDLSIPEKNGTYAIVEVVKRFGVSTGFRQDLGLGITL